MRKLLHPIVWRVGLILIIVATARFGLERVPEIQAKNTLENYKATLQTHLDNKNVIVPLENMSLKNLKVRQRASVEALYKEAQFANSEAKKGLESFKKIDLGLEVPFRSSFYKEFKDRLQPTVSFAENLKAQYSEVQKLFNYYELSSLALYNFFYYDTKLELDFYRDNPNYEFLQQSYGLAAGGLRETIQRIEKLPDYNDPTIKSFLPTFADLATQAQEISELSSQNESQAFAKAQQFSSKVISAQNSLLKNRQDFWSKNPTRLNLLDFFSQLPKQINQQIQQLANLEYRVNSGLGY